jgi:hypothetical protein
MVSPAFRERPPKDLEDEHHEEDFAPRLIDWALHGLESWLRPALRDVSHDGVVGVDPEQEHAFADEQNVGVVGAHRGESHETALLDASDEATGAKCHGPRAGRERQDRCHPPPQPP